MRSKSLDILKCVAAVFVILIHAQFPGAFGDFLFLYARWAVPCFFMISGYFSFHAIQNRDTAKIKKRVKRLVTVYLCAAVFYYVWSFLLEGLDAPAAFFAKRFTAENILKFLLLNATQSWAHLWFLPALIYCYLFVLLLFRFNKTKLLSYLPVLLCIPLAVNTVAVGVRHSNLPAEYCRNFLFMGIEFFAVGYLFKKFDAKVSALGKSLPVALFFAGLCAAVAEFCFLDTKGDLYLSTLLTAVSLFVLASHHEVRKGGRLLGYMQTATLPVYILHPAIINVIQKCYSLVGLQHSAAASWAFPVLVVLAAFGVSLLYAVIQQRLRAKKARAALVR